MNLNLSLTLLDVKLVLFLKHIKTRAEEISSEKEFLHYIRFDLKCEVSSLGKSPETASKSVLFLQTLYFHLIESFP